jgi:hypothetical protein
VIRLCELPACSNIRGAVVHQTKGGRVRVCVEHLVQALDAHDGAVLAFWKIAVPACSQPGCSRDALRCPSDQRGRGHLVCRQHFDDLSWIEIPTGLLPDEPGWSHG